MEKNTNNLPESVAAGETREGVQICPFGDYAHGQTIQHCDAAAFARVVADWHARGAKEILCDFEHKSEEGGTSDTTAAAWITNLRVDSARGLVGDFKFTDAGAEAVTNRRLRFLSVGWILDEGGVPTRVTSVALTNKPNIPVEPVLNREPSPAVEQVGERKKEMDKLKETLGLAPEAGEEEILAAVNALKEQVAVANKEKEEAEAESFAEEHKALCNKEALKKAFLLNKEAARGLVAGLVTPPAPAPTSAPEQAVAQVLLNRETSATPEIKCLNKADARAKLAALAPNERAAFYNAHKDEIEN